MTFLMSFFSLLLLAAPAQLDWDMLFPSTLKLHTGKPLAKAYFERKWTLVYFGYTSCGTVCPLAMKALAKVEKETKGMGNLQILLVTSDPKNDSTTQLATYVSHFGQNTSAVTGTQEALSRMSFFLSGRPLSSDPERHVGTIFFISPEGNLVDRFSRSMRAADLIKAVKQHFGKKENKKHGIIAGR